MVKLTQKEFTRLYKMILVLTLRIIQGTKIRELDWTERDRAQEAVQRAFERLQRVDPSSVRDFETAKKYLAGAARSELSNVLKREASRRRREKAAALDEVATSVGFVPSAEQAMFEAGQAKVESDKLDASQAHAARIVNKCREILEGDALALRTIDLLLDDITDPHEHARILKRQIRDIHNARKRRNRAIKKAEEAVRAEDDAERKPNYHEEMN